MSVSVQSEIPRLGLVAPVTLVRLEPSTLTTQRFGRPAVRPGSDAPREHIATQTRHFRQVGAKICRSAPLPPHRGRPPRVMRPAPWSQALFP